MIDGKQSSSWKGRALEWLLGAQVILRSGGKFNVSTSLVDDEGIDLVFNEKGSGKTLAIQVKSRFLSAKNHLRFNVRPQALHPRENLFMLFALYDDVEKFNVVRAWLIPSIDFDEITQSQSRKRYIVFQGSRRTKTRAEGGSQWDTYEIRPEDLAEEIDHAIAKLR